MTREEAIEDAALRWIGTHAGKYQVVPVQLVKEVFRAGVIAGEIGLFANVGGIDAEFVE